MKERGWRMEDREWKKAGVWPSIRHPLSSILYLPAALLASSGATAQTTNDIPTLSPPYAELPPTFWEQHGVAVVIGCAVFLALVVVGLWLALRPKPVATVAPEVRARQALEKLESRNEDGVMLSEISQILRRYLIAVFALPAGEPTTAEFCRLLGESDGAGSELSALAAEFLRECDLRKFAPAVPGPPLNAVARARQLVELAEVRRAQLAAAQNQTPA